MLKVAYKPIICSQIRKMRFRIQEFAPKSIYNYTTLSTCINLVTDEKIEDFEIRSKLG